MKFANSLKILMEEKNLTQSTIAKEIGFSQRAVSKWVNGESEPTETAIRRIANYFGISTDYLLGTEEYYATAPAMGEGERELLRLFRALPPEYQELALTNLRTWTGEGKKSQKKKA